MTSRAPRTASAACKSAGRSARPRRSGPDAAGLNDSTAQAPAHPQARPSGPDLCLACCLFTLAAANFAAIVLLPSLATLPFHIFAGGVAILYGLGIWSQGSMRGGARDRRRDQRVLLLQDLLAHSYFWEEMIEIPMISVPLHLDGLVRAPAPDGARRHGGVSRTNGQSCWSVRSACSRTSRTS